MPIQLVITILRALVDQYADTQEQEQKIYAARKILDKAFSNYKNKQELRDIVENIDSEFFKKTNIQDSQINIKAFIYKVVFKLDSF